MDQAYTEHRQTLEADARAGRLQGANLRRHRLDSVQWDGVNLSRVDLSDATMIGANLSGARLCQATLHRTRIGASSFVRANLTGADLSHVAAVDARFDDANLTRVDLRGACLVGASFKNARLDGVYGLPDLAVPGVAARAKQQIDEHPETYDPDVWHSDCGTRHNVAGWLVELAGHTRWEKLLGTAHTARLVLGLPLSAPCPFASDDAPFSWLADLVTRDRFLSRRQTSL